MEEKKRVKKRVVVLKCESKLAYFALYTLVPNRYDQMESNTNRTNNDYISQCLIFEIISICEDKRKKCKMV